jgi:LacI family transcriptional regulator
MTYGFSDEAAVQGLRFEIADGFTSDSGGNVIETGISRRFAAPNPPDGLLVGSTTAAMSAIAGAEQSGGVLGKDFDLVAKEAIAVLRRFRREIIIVPEDVGRAGDFLAHALVASIERRTLDQKQGLEVPYKVEWGGSPLMGEKT